MDSVACWFNDDWPFENVQRWFVAKHCWTVQDNNNNNIADNVMVLSSWHSHCRPNQPIWAVSPPIGCYHPQTPSPFIIITQLISWYSFYHSMEGGRLSWPRHCSKGAQPVPKAVYRSDCRDKRLAAVRFEPGSSRTSCKMYCRWTMTVVDLLNSQLLATISAAHLRWWQNRRDLHCIYEEISQNTKKKKFLNIRHKVLLFKMCSVIEMYVELISFCSLS